MKALTYLGNHRIEWLEQPMPVLKQETDCIVKIEKTTICGTDLHILKGNVETVAEGRILGHEGIGVIVDQGSEIRRFKKGDRVLISCITSCGHCKNCEKNFFGHCENGGWQLGNTLDGCQAEFVRIPHGDFSLHPVPEAASENPLLANALLMMSDILPTGLEVGVLEGKVEPGKSVAVVGVGPVGLAAIMAATDFSPSHLIAVDRDPNRLEVARSLGATHLIDNTKNTAAEQIMALTGNHGVDVAIEAIGTPPGWDLCENIVSAGGNIAILGVHGKPVTLHLERMWKRNFTLTAGLVHTYTIPHLIQRAVKREIFPERLISHSFKLNEVLRGYEVFLNASEHKSLKVLLENF